MKRAGFVELAAAAGVSLATVDRALNGRQKVRRETLDHIAAVARRIGHPAALRFGGAEQALRPKIRFGVALHKQGQDFYRAFADALNAAVGAARARNSASAPSSTSSARSPIRPEPINNSSESMIPT